MSGADTSALRRGFPYQGETDDAWMVTATASKELVLNSATRRDTDTDTGDVPLSVDIARQGQCGALFDGLLYNRKELEHRLQTPGLTDSELVLHAYLRWGDDVLDELKGIYAFVIGDVVHRRVLCARDRVGSHPLFYADAGGDLLVSPSIARLFGDPRVSNQVNRAALADHLAHRWPDPGETYFSAIRRIPPGHVLVASPDGRRISRYWSPVPEDEEIDWVGTDELEQFDELLTAAVTRFLGLGRAGIYLSGGLDSVSVAAFAAKASRETNGQVPLALSLGFSNEATNEQPIQRAVAADLDLPQLLVPLDEAAGPDGLVAADLELTKRWPAPMVNLWLPAYNSLAAQGRDRGCRVILSGHGGDEWLCVTPYLAADLIYSRDLKGVLRLWDNHQRSYPLASRTIIWNLLWRFGTRPLLAAASHRLAPSAMRYRRGLVGRMPSWIAPDPVLRRELAERADRSAPKPASPGRVYLAEMNRALDHALVAMELEEAFEAGRRLGVRFGHPFWDADLLTFLYRTPPELLNQGGRSKGLVRSTLARRFPQLGFERQRKVTALPVARRTMVEEGGPAWRRLGGATALADLGVVDANAVSDLMEGLLGNGTGYEANVHTDRILDIISLEAWARSHC
jgi:asparagine synthase (glutamine-hydrolysing)